MSNAAINWAYAQELPPGPKFVLVTLADVADDSGVTFRGQEFLVAATGFSKRSVSSHLQALEGLGMIGRVERRRKNGSRTSDYTVLAPHMDRGSMRLPDSNEVPQAVVDLASSNPQEALGAKSAPSGLGAKSAGGQVQILHPQSPSVEPSVKCGGNARAREAGKLLIYGRPVKPDAWRMTTDVLGVFNEVTGRDLRAVTSGGQPSEAAKRIYGRVVAYPDLSLEDHRRIIRVTLESKWWGEGRESVGVVYGPKVFEDNIARKPGAAGGKEAARAAKRERQARGQAALRELGLTFGQGEDDVIEGTATDDG